MMACDTRDAWIQFLEFAKGRCSASGNWLKPIQILEATREAIVLQVPNIFVKEYLLTQYKAELCSFLPVDANGEPAITFMIAPQQKKEAVSPAVSVSKQSICKISCIWSGESPRSIL
jgi:chromosomal replication initiator protein